MIVGCSSVHQRVAILVLGGSKRRICEKKWNELRWVVGCEKEHVRVRSGHVVFASGDKTESVLAVF